MPYNIGGYQKIHWDRGGFEVNTTQNPYYLSLNIVTKILYYTQLMFSLVFGKMWIDTSSQNTYIIHKLLCKYTFNTSYTRPLPRLRAWFENSESWHCHISMLDVAPFCVFSSFSNFFFFTESGSTNSLSTWAGVSVTASSFVSFLYILPSSNTGERLWSNPPE